MKFRRMCLETWKRQFGKPWTGIALVAATFLLILNVLQTYYTWKAYEVEVYKYGPFALRISINEFSSYMQGGSLLAAVVHLSSSIFFQSQR
jgi:hypothetical protein